MVDQEGKQKFVSLHTLIPLDDFKALMGIDDREDKQARFCLTTATLNIEQYCKRSFLCKQYFETVKISRDLIIPLKEYPVIEILTVYTYNKVQLALSNGQILEPEFYRPMLGNDYNEEMLFELLLSASLIPYKLAAVKVIYYAGYKTCDIPTDLSAACMELAMWNMNRYRGRRIGITGNIKGSGSQGEHFERTMPENVKTLIEPYRRKTI